MKIFYLKIELLSERKAKVNTIIKKNVALSHDAEAIFGTLDENLTYLESCFDVKLLLTPDALIIEGDERDVAIVERMLLDFYQIRDQGVSFNNSDLKGLIKIISEDPSIRLQDCIFSPQKRILGKKQIKPRSLTQHLYLQSIENSQIVFGIGPAGTGKTYLAVAMAVSFLLNRQVNRIILARPAVEAGERLGFLPGNLQEKIDPYLRPLYDALYEMLDIDKVDRYLERGSIEIAPIAFMRGRTLNDAFVILDEAQNTTPEQMKMFLTRLGFNSKVVITGDITQIDLPSGKISGLVQVKNVVSKISEINFIYFNQEDVVRHPLVQKIVGAYNFFESKEKPTENKGFYSPGS